MFYRFTYFTNEVKSNTHLHYDIDFIISLRSKKLKPVFCVLKAKYRFHISPLPFLFCKSRLQAICIWVRTYWGYRTFVYHIKMKDILNKPFNTCTTSVIDKLNTYTIECLKQKSFNIYHLKPSSCKKSGIYKYKRRE